MRAMGRRTRLRDLITANEPLSRREHSADDPILSPGLNVGADLHWAVALGPWAPTCVGLGPNSYTYQSLLLVFHHPLSLSFQT